jgi:EmrB/QacA subfamily drug resistance transporter
MSGYLIFIAVNLVQLLAAISTSAISVAFPNITSSFNTSLVMAGWVLSIYQLVVTGSMVLMGKVSDAFGRRNTLLVCLSLFIVGSLLCAIAPDIQLLILFRLIQGIGGGGFVPSTVGIVADQFPRSRQKAIGLSMSIFPIGGIIGPNLGGWLVTTLGWRSIFWFNVPFSIAACIAIALLLKSEQGHKSHIDLVGASLFIGSLFALMIGLSEIGNGSSKLSWLLVGILFAAGLILMVIFIRHEVKAKDPIIDLEFLRKKPFVAANVYNFIFGACIFGFSSFVPLYAVSVYGMSTLQSGLVLTSRSIGMILAATVSSFFLVRWGYRWPMLIGTVAIAISFLLMGAEPSHVGIMGTQLSGMALLSAVVLLSGLGMGVANPAANNACLDLMPHRAATISGIRGMFRHSGGAISIAIISLLLQHIGNMARGFYIVFLGMGIIILITIPFIFAMPSKTEQA